VNKEKEVTKDASKVTGKKVSENKPSSESRKVSFGEKYRNRSKETVIVIGDSHVRGVGRCLERNSNMYTSKPYPGIRIEQVGDRLKQMGDKPDSQVVVVVGTNNLKSDGSVVMLDEYEDLIKTAQGLRYKKLSFASIPERKDVGDFHNSRRLGVNDGLKKMCAEKGVGFIEISNVRQHLGHDDLHLNYVGQDKVAYEIFTHCKQYSN
jgi:hypothetical protein